MIHIRCDHFELNKDRKFVCGIGPELPPGDVYYFESEIHAYMRSDCLGCNPDGPKKIGTPISQLSGRPGTEGYARFCAIAESWGCD